MDDSQRASIEARLERLERELAELRQLLTAAGESAAPSAPSQPAPLHPASPPHPEMQPAPQPQFETAPQQPPPAYQPTTSERPSFALPQHMRSLEYWLNKVGIGLVLFAVVFLFKYSVDQGWLTPQVRVILGLALGVVLVALALHIQKKQPPFSLVLFGGGVATFYISCFAAYQWYALVAMPIAFGFMAAVALFTIAMSLRSKQQVLAVIGTLGGFSTPFLLYTGQSNVPGLMTYVSILIAAVAVIYFFKSWRGLLWMTVAIGWIVVGVAMIEVWDLGLSSVSRDHWSVQFGIILCWLAFWAVPLMRDVYAERSPDRIFYKPFAEAVRRHFGHLEPMMKRHNHLLVVSTPLIALALSAALWESQTDRFFWGWVAMGLALVDGLVAYRIKLWSQLKEIGYTHLLVALLLFTVALSLLLDGDTLLIALATEALILLLIAKRTDSRGIRAYGFVLYFLLLPIMMDRINGPVRGDAVFLNQQTLSDFWVIATTLVFAWFTKDSIARRIFIIVPFGLLAGILARELDGNLLFALVTAEAGVLHLIGRRLKDRPLTVAADIFVALVGVWLIDRLMILDVERFPIDLGHAPFISLTALSDMLYLALLFGVATLRPSGNVKTAYLVWGHIIVLALVLREFQGIENGQGFVTILWGLYALGLLVAGLRRNISQLRTVAVVTLALVVGKMFLIDLANLETIWRILLFFGFGGLLLFVSYYFKLLWKKS